MSASLSLSGPRASPHGSFLRFPALPQLSTRAGPGAGEAGMSTEPVRSLPRRVAGCVGGHFLPASPPRRTVPTRKTSLAASSLLAHGQCWGGAAPGFDTACPLRLLCCGAGFRGL